MGYILDGKYHKGTKNLTPSQQSTWKQHDHDRQRSDFARDLIQPYTIDGKPNEKFIEAFPVESKEVYHFIPSDEELRSK